MEVRILLSDREEFSRARGRTLYVEILVQAILKNDQVLAKGVQRLTRRRIGVALILRDPNPDLIIKLFKLGDAL